LQVTVSAALVLQQTVIEFSAEHPLAVQVTFNVILHLLWQSRSPATGATVRVVVHPVSQVAVQVVVWGTGRMGMACAEATLSVESVTTIGMTRDIANLSR
jgi:hypothetical protein